MPIGELLAVSANQDGKDNRGLLESGLFPATTPVDVPLWFKGRNVLFRQGGVQKQPGFVAPVGLTIESGVTQIRGMDALTNLAAIQHLFFGDTANAYRWSAGTRYTITRASGAYTGNLNETSTRRASAWSGARFGNIEYLTNGVDLGQEWLGADPCQNWTTPTWTRAETLLRGGPHVVALNTNNFPGGYEWCDLGNPDVWTPTATNAAGNQDIRDIDGDVIGGCPAFGELVAAARSSLYLLPYTGAPIYFPYRTLMQGIGIAGKMAMVAANRRLYGLMKSGIWEFDGAQYVWIDVDPIRDYWQSVVDMDQLSKVCTSYDSDNDMVLFSIPDAVTGENQITLGFGITNRSWTVFDWGRSSMLAKIGVFTAPFMSGVADAGAAKVYLHNFGHDADGEELIAFVQTKPFDCGAAQHNKILAHVLLDLRRVAGNVFVRVGTQRLLTDAIAWTGFLPVDAAMDRITTRTTGRFITLEISTSGLGSDFACNGFAVFGRIGGRWVSGA